MDGLENYSRSTARGVAPLPLLQAATLTAADKKTIKLGTKKPKKVSDVCESYTAVASHFHKRLVDMSFSISAEYKGETKEEIRMGRIWSSNYTANWLFTQGGHFPSSKLELAPAFAGFNHGMQDQAAMRALAALSASLGSTQRETIPDDTRASVNTLLTTRFQATRMLLRMAALWTAAAIAETGGTQLQLHSNGDDRTPAHIGALGDFSIAVTAAQRQGVQPLFVHVRGAAEGMRYTRVARMLALDRPRTTLQDGTTSPTVLGLWPTIPNCKVYFLSAVDQVSPLGGPVSSRDIAIFASYYARALNLQEELSHWLQFTTSFGYRPAGTAAYGTHQDVIMQLPQSQLGPTVLLPIVQAVDTLDSESISCEMDEPQSLLLAGIARASVYLSAFQNVSSAALGHLVTRASGQLAHRAAKHQRQFHTRSADSAPSTCATIALASKLGWDEAFSEAWMALSPNPTIASGPFLPIESEEALPWLEALPATAALLGLLKPCRIKTAPAPGQYLQVGVVEGRMSDNDAFYSLQAIKAQPTITQVLFSQDWPERPKTYRARLSYRHVPCDAQYLTHNLGDCRWTCLFQLPSTRGVLQALNAHELRGNWTWHYEWHNPFTWTDALEQFVQEGAPLPPPLPSSPSPQHPGSNLVTVPAAPPPDYPAGPPGDPNILRDHLGDAWGAIVDSRNAIAAVVGRQLETTRYESMARTFAGAVTGIDFQTLSVLVDPMVQPLLWSWMALYADEAAAWSPSPGMQENCRQVAAFSRANLGVYAEPSIPTELEHASIPSRPPDDEAAALQAAIDSTAGSGFHHEDRAGATTAQPAGDTPTGGAGSPPSTPSPEPPRSPTAAASGPTSPEPQRGSVFTAAEFTAPTQ